MQTPNEQKEQILNVISQLTNSKNLEEVYQRLTMLEPSNLHNYQINAAKFIMKTPRCALWCEMGLGKTIITLTALREILRHCPTYRVLIVAPKRVCATVWAQEANKWTHTNHLTLSNIVGTPKQREEKAQNDTQIHLIGVDLIKWLVKLHGKNWPYDVVIIDESSCFKDPKTQRFKALKKVISYSKQGS